MAYKALGDDNKPVLVARTAEGKHIVFAGNFKDTPDRISVKIGDRYLEATVKPHSFNTFAEK